MTDIWLALMAFAGAVGLVLVGIMASVSDDGIPRWSLAACAVGVLLFLVLAFRTAWQQPERKPTGPPFRIEVPMPMMQHRVNTSDPPLGWMFSFQNVRVTNTSDQLVGLDFVLHVPLEENPSGLTELVIPEETSHFFQPQMPSGVRPYFQCPLEIEPRRTVVGYVGFWLMSIHEKPLGGDVPSLVRRGDDLLDESWIEVVTTDGERFRVETPGSDVVRL